PRGDDLRGARVDLGVRQRVQAREDVRELGLARVRRERVAAGAVEDGLDLLLEIRGQVVDREGRRRGRRRDDGLREHPRRLLPRKQREYKEQAHGPVQGGGEGPHSRSIAPARRKSMSKSPKKSRSF